MEKSILIVDDMVAVVMLLEELLKQNFPECRFVTAGDGAEACKKAVREKPDLILMDWEMPNMDGETALKKLKQHQQTSNIPVIILSATTDDKRLRNALDLGAIDFINKPINETELIARVKSAMILSDTLSKLSKERDLLENANAQNEAILKAILPKQILEKIVKFGSIPPKNYKNCAVIFIDLVDFTAKSSHMSPARLLRELHDLFTNFDIIMRKYQCTRIKTIGDAYLSVCGLFNDNLDVGQNVINAAVNIRDYVAKRNIGNSIKWELRTGVYYGDVIGSAVSTTNLAFDIFGETVNMASRLEHSCEPMQINVSEDIYHHLKDKYKFVARSPRMVKGKGITPMYYLHKPLKKNSNKALEMSNAFSSTTLPN